MMKLCLMASHGYPPGIVLHHDLEITRVIKDFHPYLASPVSRQEIAPSLSFTPMPDQFNEPWRPFSPLCKSNQFVGIDSAVRRPLLIDVQDTHPDWEFFSFGIAEQFARQEKVMKFLMSGSSELERGGLDMSLISDMMGPETLKFYVQQPDVSSLTHINCESEKPLLDFVGDMARSANISVQPDGQVLFAGRRAELNDILSIVAEFYFSKYPTRGRKFSPVPHFTRLGSEIQATMLESPARFEAVTVAPLKSPEKTKLKPLPRRKNLKKATRERDLYKRNYFHACESLLSLMINKNQPKKTTILSLKKSGPELPELLTQFSAGIAGTGIAVLFSIICKVACGRVPFTAAKLFETGFGCGLVWLSWAVNKLRDTIINITRNATKSSLTDEEMMSRVERSMKDVYFSAATLLAAAVLRVA